MNTILLDTHVLLWLLEGDQRLGHEAHQLADTAVRQGTLLVSAMTFWEVAMLTRRQCLALAQSAASWRQRVLEMGVTEIPVSGDIGILSTEFEDFPPDPADRIITATAVVHGAILVTADTSILGWKGQVGRHDARS